MLIYCYKNNSFHTVRTCMITQRCTIVYCNITRIHRCLSIMYKVLIACRIYFRGPGVFSLPPYELAFPTFNLGLPSPWILVLGVCPLSLIWYSIHTISWKYMTLNLIICYQVWLHFNVLELVLFCFFFSSRSIVWDRVHQKCYALRSFSFLLFLDFGTSAAFVVKDTVGSAMLYNHELTVRLQVCLMCRAVNYCQPMWANFRLKTYPARLW